MTKYAMVADLNRCVGCQTCTAACKQANATAPGVQWRKVLDVEVGEFPEVSRAFVPVGCMHCDDPPCLDVCPSTATKKRADGIVTIDYDICIGCAYCAVACPYQARFRVDEENAAFGEGSMRHEVTSEHWDRKGVAQKCTFCLDRVEPGLANGFTPGIDHEATPVCVNSCIADALHFGDIDDPESNVSKLVAENGSFRMHEDVGTSPRFYYLWENGIKENTPGEPAPMVSNPAGMSAVSPKLQTHWDWRAAANFLGGGAGTGLFAAASLFGLISQPLVPAGLLSLALVASGLFFVWLEIGRPWRFMNVYFHSKLSWMTREAMVAPPFFALGLLAIMSGWPLVWLTAASVGIVFLYCQGRILAAAKGIPAWRQEGIVGLIIVTGLVEGLGLFAAIFVVFSSDNGGLIETLIIAMLAVLSLRYFAWQRYRKALGKKGAPVGAFRALDNGFVNLSLTGQLLVAALVVLGLVTPLFLVAGGILALATGWNFKFTLITKAAFDQGYAIERMPARGFDNNVTGIKPGWTLS